MPEWVPAAPLASGSGVHFGEPYPLGALFLGVAVFAAVAAISHQRERAFSASLIYLCLGAGAAVAIDSLGLKWLDPLEDHKVIERVAEAAVVVALFSTGMQIDRRLHWREWSSAVRLIAIAMPLTIAGVALLGSVLLGLSLGAAIALGAALAPTDPVLAGDVGVGPPGDEDEHEPNFSLTSEAGLNDGFAGPFVLLGLVIAASSGDWTTWVLADVLYAPIAGAAIGAALGLLAAWSVKRLRDRDLLNPHLDGFHAIGTALVIYGVAELLSTLGFIAVFAGGLAFRRYERDHVVNRGVHMGAEQVEKILELVAILLLGSLLTTSGLALPGWEGWLLAVLLLVVVRPLSCLASFVGSRLEHPEEKAFVSWFGVRGVGTLYYVMIIAGAGVLSPAETELVVWTGIACVVLSIPVFGLSAGPSMRRLMARERARSRAARRREPTPAGGPR
jgi:NhaP-type Na+/H+ or K+/H+ antiporter